MSKSEEKNGSTKYYYYDYHNGYIAREEVGNNYCACERFEFYLDGKWVENYDLSLSLSDATWGCCDCSFFEYEELTEEEAMCRIFKIQSK